MRKILKNQNEVAHYWANKVQAQGKASNMFFQGEVIYSYGYHFPIYIKWKNTWYENSNKYSVSTSKHQSQARPSAKTKLLNTNQMKQLIHKTSIKENQ